MSKHTPPTDGLGVKPWVVDSRQRATPLYLIRGANGDVVAKCYTEEEAVEISEAINRAPALLAEVEQLKAENEKLQRQVSKLLQEQFQNGNHGG
jgi:hypothetical protein